MWKIQEYGGKKDKKMANFWLEETDLEKWSLSTVQYNDGKCTAYTQSYFSGK